ncbi:MAG: LysR family transcriptional regulator [Lachnospiraceae bacterium]|nr:LysR family transcriptional regulator [Lachnospiraceae bacterium]
MEFRRIEYFLELAEKLNYAKAANELCISSQALTKQIQLLEEELGTRLFDRTTRSVSLTEDGVLCKERFSKLKEHYDAAIADVENAIRSKNHIVRIGFFAALPKNELVNPLIHMLSSEFEQIDFEIKANNMDGLREQLKSGETDLALTNAHDYEDWKGCEIVVFKTVPAQIVVSSKHPWVKEGKKKITKKDMAEADILLLEKRGPYEFNSFYGRVKAKSRTIVPDFDSMMIELEKGKRYAVFPMVFNDAQHSNFVCYDLPDDYLFHFRTMCACRTQKASAEVKKIFQFIKKHKKDFSF